MDNDKSGSSSQFAGKFCWEEIGGVAIPFIIRGSGEMLAEISMLKKTAFKKQLEVLSEEVFQIACPWRPSRHPLKQRITKLELKLLNEINAVHCHNFFSKVLFLRSTFLLSMGDVVQLYQLLDVFYKVVTESKIDNPRCGYILIDKSNTPIPFVDIQNVGIVVPLFFFECPKTMSIKLELEDHWPLTYLKLFCKLLCVRNSFYDSTALRVVRLSDLKDVIPEASQFTFMTTLPANVKIAELKRSKILRETFKMVNERKIRPKVNKLPENISKQPDEVIIIDDNDEETFTIDSEQDESVASKKTVPNILKSKNPVLLKCIQVDPRKSSEAEKTLTVVETTSSPTLTSGGSRIKQNSSQSPKTRNKSLVVSRRLTQIVHNKTSSATQSIPEPEKVCNEATIERSSMQCETRNQHIKPITSHQKNLSDTSNTSITLSSNLVSSFTASTASSALTEVNTFPSTSEESCVDQNLSNSHQNKKILRVVSKPSVIKISIPEFEKVCKEATSETSAEAQENLSTSSITPSSNLVSPSAASTSSSAPPMVNKCTLTSGETVMEQNLSNTTATVGCATTDSGPSLSATPSPMKTLSSGGFFIEQNLSNNSQTSIPSSLATVSTTSSAPTLLNTPPGTSLLASGGTFIQSNLCNSAVVPSANSIVSSTQSLTSSTPIMSNISHHSHMLPSGGSLSQSNLSNTLQTSSISSYNVAVSSTAFTTSATPTVLNNSELLPVVPFTQSTSNTASNLLVRSSTTHSTEIISIGDSNPTKNIVQSSNIVVSSKISTSSSSSAVSNIVAPTVTLTPEGLLIKNSSRLDNTSLLQCNPYSYNILPSQLGLQVLQPSGLVAAQSTGLGMSQGMAIQPQAGAIAQGQQTVQQSPLGVNASNSLIILQQQCFNMDWPNETVLRFLDFYEEEPIIWNASHPRHKNWIAVRDAWKRIQEQLGAIYTVDELKKKKDSLMGHFRKNLNKVKSSVKSGASTDNIYKPNWFAYDRMIKFLRDKDEPRETINSEVILLEPLENSSDSIEQADNSLDIENDGVVLPSNSKMLLKTSCKKRKDISAEEHSVLQAYLDKPAPQKDMCDIYGELVAAKMRKMDEYSRQICMHRMDTVMFEMMINPTFDPNRSPVFPMTSNPQITIVPSPASSVQSLSSYQQSSQPSPIPSQSPLSRPVTPALSPNIPNYDSSNHVSHLLVNPTFVPDQSPALHMASNQQMETVRSHASSSSSVHLHSSYHQTSQTSFTPSQSALPQPITPDLSPNVPNYISHLSMNPTSVSNQSPASPVTSNQQMATDQNVGAQSSTLEGSTGNLEKHPRSLLQPRLTALQNNEDVILVDEASKNQT